MKILFDYKKVVGVPNLCPCKDPGDYMACEQPTDEEPLSCLLRCWCGRTARVEFNSLMDKAKFLEMNGAKAEDN